LRAKGYTIITRRYKARRGEIDLVAMDGETLVFVEVKYRRAAGYVPEESIGTEKLRSLQRAMRQYLDEMEIGEVPARLDLVAIDGNGIRHYQDLFGQ